MTTTDGTGKAARDPGWSPPASTLAARHAAKHQIAAIIGPHLAVLISGDNPWTATDLALHRQMAVRKLQRITEADAGLLTRWMQWAEATVEMGLQRLGPEGIAMIIGETLVDGWALKDS